MLGGQAGISSFVLLALTAGCLWLSVVTVATAATTPRPTTGRYEDFNHDVDVMEGDEKGRRGQRLRLRSRGVLADVIHLDSLSQIKHVVCSGNRLLLAMTDSTVAQGWQEGQVVLGSPRWNCNATTNAGRKKSSGIQIYVRISKVILTVEDRNGVSGVDMVTIHCVPAGPFDMLREANIFFHYEPGQRHHHQHRDDNDNPHNDHQRQHNDTRSRFRRSVSNALSKILDNVNWQASFSSVIPLSVGEDSEKLALHKTWGQNGLSVTMGTSAVRVDDDFVLLLENLAGENRVSYTFDLVIKNVEGSPQIVRYISQFDVESDITADASVKFSREMGVSYNTTVRESPKQELFRIPVVKTVGLPPVYLTVTSQSLISATVRAYSAGASVLKTGYSGSGAVTLSQTYDPTPNKGSEVTARDWSVQPRPQSLASRVGTQMDFSVYQKLMFNSAIFWDYQDMNLELSPPAELTLRPMVSLRSSTRGLARCVDSTAILDSVVRTASSYLTVTAFGLRLWEVPLQRESSKNLLLQNTTLGTFCEARCKGPSQLISSLTDPTIGPFTRADEQFKSLRKVDGNQVQFVDSGSDAAWCGRPGVPCFSCSSQAYDTPPDRTCAARLMTSRMATAVSHLAGLIEAEWSQKRLLVLEAWDEGTSRNPSGRHEPTSLYKHGRAATVGLTSRTPGTTPTPAVASSASAPADLLILDLQTLDRLGQLAVCSGFGHVQLEVLDSTVEVGVSDSEVKDGVREVTPSLGDESEEEEDDLREEFWDVLRNVDVTSLHPHCVSAPRLDPGTTWPDVTGTPEAVCGPTDKALLRTDGRDMAKLVQFNTDGASLAFDPEGFGDSWCGVPSRQCIPDCSAPTQSASSWDWCSTRMMTPRLALRLQTLQKLAEIEGLELVVKQGLGEKTQANSSPAGLFSEGGALKMSTVPVGKESILASLAVCAGFDFVEHRHDGHVNVYVISQHGYRAQTVEFLEATRHDLPLALKGLTRITENLAVTGSSHVVIPSHAVEDSDNILPTVELMEEAQLPFLVDGGFRPDVYLSEHVTTRDVTSGGSNSRYFRMDELLLVCVEMVIDDFPLQLEIVRDSAYRTRSDDFLHNLDARHKEEQWRHQTGQALELRPLPAANSSTLFLLAKSILRVCPSVAESKMKAVGLGCHDDSIYVDVRPLLQSGDLGYVTVWDTKTGYCSDVVKLQVNMLAGGPVIQSDVTVTCRDRGLDPGTEFLAFQMGQTDLCNIPRQSEFCTTSLSAREDAADRLQEVLTASAGHGRLPRYEIIADIRACLVDHCGGCAGSGAIFDKKVKHCSRLVHTFLERAAAPYPDMTDAVTFFNTDTDESHVHGAACKTGNVCVEETMIYSLLLPTVTARFSPDPRSSVERGLFDAAVNPTPLLDIAAQELAARASGLVTVFIHSERDTYALRNVLKVLFTYNKNVSLVEFQVAPGVNSDLVSSSIQRKITTWAGVVCPEHGRFAITPFLVMEMDPVRHKRSSEMSKARNQVASNIYNWEKEWLKKMV